MNGESTQLVEQEPVPPRILAGRFELSEPLGRDRFGTVHLANDVSHKGSLRSLTVTVALRILDRELRAADRDSLCSQATKAIEFKHPAIARIFECGKAEGEEYFTFEPLRGVELDRRLATKRLKPYQANRVLRDLAAALAYLEKSGVTFDAISPAAILFEPEGGIKLLAVPAMHALEPDAVRGDSAVNAFGAFAHLVVYGSLPRANGERRRGLLSLLGRDPNPRHLTALIDRCIARGTGISCEEISKSLSGVECPFPPGAAKLDPVAQRLMETNPTESPEAERNGTLFVFFLALYLVGILSVIGIFSVS